MRFSIIIALFFFTVTLSSCATSRGPEHFYFGNYSEAEEYFNKGEYEEAIEKYQAYIDENPEGNLAVISRYYIAKSHVALGNTAQAKEIFKSIAKSHPDLVWADFAETQLEELEAASSS